MATKFNNENSDHSGHGGTSGGVRRYAVELSGGRTRRRVQRPKRRLARLAAGSSQRISQRIFGRCQLWQLAGKHGPAQRWDRRGRARPRSVGQVATCSRNVAVGARGPYYTCNCTSAGSTDLDRTIQPAGLHPCVRPGYTSAGANRPISRRRLGLRSSHVIC